MNAIFSRPSFLLFSRRWKASDRRRYRQRALIRQSIEPLEPRQYLSVTFGQETFLDGFPISPDAVVDLNGDGKPDIVGLGENGQGIEIYVNQGNGTFGAPIVVPDSTGAGTGMAIGDFNGDGVPDIAVISGNETVSCFLGAGTNVNGTNPSFLAPVVSSYALDAAGDISQQSVIKPTDTSTSPVDVYGNTSQQLQTAHFGGTMDDLVVDDAAGGNLVQVLLATGGGHFQTGTANVLAGPGGSEIPLINRFEIADFNGDGISDIAYVGVVDNSSYGIIVQFGAIGGTFLTSQYPYAVPNGGPIDILAAPLTSPNGLPDLICNDENFANVDVLLNNGGGSFGTATVYPVSDSQDMSIGDFDDNGALDISAGSQILFNTGAGTFSPATDDSSYALSGRISADLNGDGFADLVLDGVGVELEGASSGGGGGGGSGSNLSGALTGSSPSSAIVGQKTKITQKLAVTNNSGATITGNVTGTLYLSSDGAIDSNAISLNSQTKKNLKLKANAHTSFSLKATSIPSSTTSGTYQLIAQISDSSGTTDITGGTITIAPAQIDLAGSFAKQPVPAKHGKTTLTLSLTNDGNVSATGPLEISIETSPDGQIADATALPAQTKKINLKPNVKPKKITLPVALPAGTYFLVIQLDPGNTFQDVDLANNIFATSVALTVG